MSENATTTGLTYSAPIGPSQWRLTAVARGSATCDHCDRRLMNTFTVTNPAGQEMTLGRACCKKVTGYDLSMNEAARMLRVEFEAAQRAAVWAQFSAADPESAALINADVNAYITWYGTRTGRNFTLETGPWNGILSDGGPAGEVRGWIGQGRPADQMLTGYLRRRQAGEFYFLR